VGTSGSIVIPDATFAEGDAVSIFNNTSGNIVISCLIANPYIAGSNTTLSNKSGTYSQSATTVTVTFTAHGLIVGDTISADITSGSGVDGPYTVATVADANTFTYTAGTSLTTSGNITFKKTNIALATRGLATVLFISGTVCVVSGTVT
jgi:hypothetical protein